jgi:hypothetical protein
MIREITDEELKFIEHCAGKGVVIQAWQAEAFLRARKILETNPKDEIPLAIICDFTKALQTRQPVAGFSQFLI